MLYTDFQTSGPSGSIEDFLIYIYAFLWFEPRTPWCGAILAMGPSFVQNWLRTTRQCFILNFKHLSQEVLKEKLFEYFSMYFHDLNLCPPGAGPSWTLGPSFEQSW